MEETGKMSVSNGPTQQLNSKLHLTKDYSKPTPSYDNRTNQKTNSSPVRQEHLGHDNGEHSVKDQKNQIVDKNEISVIHEIDCKNCKNQ